MLRKHLKGQEDVVVPVEVAADIVIEVFENELSAISNRAQ
jgi:hypothetical protein